MWHHGVALSPYLQRLISDSSQVQTALAQILAFPAEVAKEHWVMFPLGQNFARQSMQI